MKKTKTLYTFIGEGVNNLTSNLNNIIKAFNITDIKKYHGEKLENSILWIFAHGMPKPKPESIQEKLIIKTYKNIHDISSTYYDDFIITIKNGIYLKSKDFPKFFNCENCDIIIDSCYSNTIDISIINYYVNEKKNNLFFSGYEKELNTIQGSTLNYFLYNYSLHKDINNRKELKKSMETFNKFNKTSLFLMP